MLDHVGVPVSDFMRSKGFYLKVLARSDMISSSKWLPKKPAAIVTPASVPGQSRSSGLAVVNRSGAKSIFAFTAKDRAAVRAFHQAALKAGGKDNGPPGLRPHYHQNYYGAFVLDPDGHNIEAVCHLPSSPWAEKYVRPEKIPPAPKLSNVGDGDAIWRTVRLPDQTRRAAQSPATVSGAPCASSRPASSPPSSWLSPSLSPLP
jgi:catechol 2,3-dioxygenase-like lactoylglutathione lyase family enzyme